jgi:V/A-type H+-transporting ATPase subunit D
MAIQKVSPTRIALLTLKKELKTAEKGHKLLKDKRDGLVKKFMAVIFEAKSLRESVEARLGSAFDSYTRASSMTAATSLDTAFMAPNAKIDLGVTVKSVMSVKIP